MSETEKIKQLKNEIENKDKRIEILQNKLSKARVCAKCCYRMNKCEKCINS